MSVHHDPVMMNLWDVPDMNVGDMVNECTSRYNVSYTIHVTNAVIHYTTHYVYTYLSVNIRLDIR